MFSPLLELSRVSDESCLLVTKAGIVRRMASALTRASGRSRVAASVPARARYDAANGER